MDWDRDYFRPSFGWQTKSVEEAKKKGAAETFRGRTGPPEEGREFWVVGGEEIHVRVVDAGISPRRPVGEWSSAAKELTLLSLLSQVEMVGPREWREASRQQVEALSAVQSTLQRLSKVVDSLARSIDDLSSRVDTISTELEGRPVVKQTRLSDLGTDRYALKEPIHVTIEEYADETIASYPEISTYASGATESEAVANLKVGILALYEDLVSSKPEELGSLPLGWLRILRRIIEKRG